MIMKPTILIIALVFGLIPFTGTQAKTVTNTVRVEALIDGRSQVILRANTAHWFHIDFAAPGRHAFQNEPTVINGVEWFPIWPDIPNAENRDCNCFSDIFSGLDPPLLQTDMTINFRIIQSRSLTSIVQLPSASNDFTLIIEFNDNGVSGSDFYIIEIDFTFTLIGELDELVNIGVLKPGQVKSLKAKLAAALQKLNQGNVNAAINQLGAFINEVNAFINAGVLSAIEGQPLIDSANNIINQLNG